MICGLLFYVNWLDIANQEIHFKYYELRDELEELKGKK